MKLKMLDMCCGGGLAARGYMQAAQDLGIDFIIVGVDVDFQEAYPGLFIQADAMKYFMANESQFNCFHASPPCQQYSVTTARLRKEGKKYIDIIKPIHELFSTIEKPSIIENVISAPIRSDIVLRGDMFGLKVLKKRKFEIYNWFCMQPGVPQKRGFVKNGDFAQVVGNGQNKVTNGLKFNVPGNSVNEVWKNAMGINEPMSNHDMAEGFPPAYSHYLGLQLFQQLMSKNATKNNRL